MKFSGREGDREGGRGKYGDSQMRRQMHSRPDVVGDDAGKGSTAEAESWE